MMFGFVHNREAIVQFVVIGNQQKKQVILCLSQAYEGGSVALSAQWKDDGVRSIVDHQPYAISNIAFTSAKLTVG
jgi:hypothetical protein